MDPSSSTPDTELRLPANPSAPSRARGAIRSFLNGTVHPEVLLDVLIVTSELVTNSVLHADLSPEDAIRLRLWSGPPIRVEVEDDGTGLAEERGGTGGWGLSIVSTLSESWGVRFGQGALAWAVLRARPLPRTSTIGLQI